MGLFRERFKVKACRGCGKVLATDEFYKNKFNEDGLDHYCKFCRQEYNSEWTKKNPARRYTHQWRYRNRDFRKGINIKSTRLHDIWKGMLTRCSNPKSSNYHRYGGRGITVCDAWKDFTTFRDWALNNGYRGLLSIDRIDNDGNYCPENCRWTTSRENSKRARRLAAQRLTYNALNC